MNDELVAIELASLIIKLTDPEIEKWRKHRYEVNARAKAKSYLERKLEEASD